MLNVEFLFVEWMIFFQFLFLPLTVTVTVWQSQSDNDLNYCIWSWLLLDYCKYVGWVLGTHIGAKEGGYLNFVVNRDIIALYDFIHTGWKLLHMYRKYTVNFKILFQTFSDRSYRLCMQSAKLIRYAYEYCRYITNTTGIFRDCHDCICAMCIQCNVSVYFNIHWIMQA